MKTINTYLIWILLLCLPLQGLATAPMASCLPMGSALQQVAAPDDGAACHPKPAFDAGSCNTAAGVLPAACAAPGQRLAVPAPSCSGPIAYISAYASTFFPDGLERPPHWAARP